MEHQGSTAEQVRCGACNRGNTLESKFCADCGQPLVESCGKCARPVVLTRSFCENCGTDLDQLLQIRRQRHRSWFAEALAAAKVHDYQTAKDLLSRVAELTDYRFMEEAGEAAAALERVIALEKRSLEYARQTITQAKAAAANGDLRKTAKYLSSVPEKLLDQDEKELHARARKFASHWTSLESELRVAIEAKDLILVGRLVQQLLDLDEQNPSYQKLAVQVSGELFAKAKHSLEQEDCELAVSQLNAIPQAARSAEIGQISEQANNIHWLSDQFDHEPFASPTLGRIAVRLAKETPRSEKNQQRVKQLAAQLKEAPRLPRMHLPRWKGSVASWLGGEVGILGLPTSIADKCPADAKLLPGRFHVAIGLALQGLGIARNRQDLLLKKKGFLTFANRPGKACWGVDIGTSSIKAVCLQATEEGPQIVDSYFAEFNVPLSPRGNDVDHRSTLEPVIGQFIQSKQPSTIPVWANLTGSHSVQRFLRLPPVKDKDANSMLRQEVQQKIPIPADELSVAYWVRELSDDVAMGRPAVVTAVRRKIVADRTELLESCGLKLAGLQCDPSAIVNFAAHEFGSLWQQPGKADGDPIDQAQLCQAVALVDAGASTTNLVIVSGESHWSWTLEIGGEDLTSMITRSTKQTRKPAEALKRNPALLVSPSAQYELVEQRLNELRARLETVLSDALRQNSKWRIKQSWCMGGGCQAHQWIRRVMLDGSKSSYFR